MYKYLVIFIALFVASCSKDSTTNSESPNRPHDPWVFRSVLDLKPRVITMALHDKIWVAYSTEHAAFYKAWQGTVFFDGAVYTAAHGPQPISIGDAYAVNKFINPWLIDRGNMDTSNAMVNYLGHKFVDNHVQLMYDVYDAKGVRARVTEQVEAAIGQGVTLDRKYNVSGLKGNEKLVLKQSLSSIVVKESIKTNGQFITGNTTEKKMADDRTVLDIDGFLVLKNGETDFTVSFIDKPTIKNTNHVGGQEDEVIAEGQTGLSLIAKSDCKTCHNKTRKTVGPAYTEIAEKYTTDENTIQTLVQKVKKGGSGIWGNVAMTAHEDLAEEDIRLMVEYVLSLDAETEKKASAPKEKIKTFVHATLDTNKVLPGAITKIYKIPTTAQKIPDLSKMKFYQAGIKNNFDNLDGSDFADLTDNFALSADGLLRVDVAGEYSFEIWSDDGSKLYLHNDLFIDNDGPHGTIGKIGTAKLDKGYHPFRLEYYQGGGGKYLSLNWVKPGDKQAEVIPVSNILHLPDPKNNIEGYKLPLSYVSTIPGNKSPLTEVHPSFTLSQARPDDFEPKVGGIDFMKDGSMIVSTWDQGGSLWRLTNTQSGDPKKIKAMRIAFGLAEPLGVKVVNDTIYVMQKQEMTRLIDNNKDHIIDEYHTLCDDWTVSPNFHEFGFGLEYKDGHFYATLATAIEPGGASTRPQMRDRGKVIKVNKNTGQIEFIASGLRTPNGIGIGYDGELFVADNQGDWLPSSKIVHVTNGAWFGSRSVDSIGTQSLKETAPLVWLPQDEIGNSPSQPSYINVGPYKGQMIHGEVTHGGIKRVFVEKVNNQLQGCVFRFIQGLEAGINRLKWGPDGALYVGGVGNPGNWGHSGKKWYGLQRLQYNNKSTFEMLAVRAKANGLEVEYTEPLASGEGQRPSDYEIRQWYYKPTKDYGGPKLGEAALNVKSVTLSSDRKKAFLQIDGLKAGHVVYVHNIDGLISSQGNSIWSTEAWYTLNQLPQEKGEVKNNGETFADNTLTKEEEGQGWRLLFDGKKIDQFHNFNKKTIGSSWVVNDNAMHLLAVRDGDHWQAKDGGDIVTNDAFENFEFKVDWKITNCGNSGIMFSVVEDPKYDYAWKTGPEMQVLDNTCHPDTRFKTHRAGDLYDMIESKFSCAKPAGEWNKAKIVKQNGKVDFYLNGYKTASINMNDPSWKKMIAQSKFKDMPNFGLAPIGRICLQDHGDKVWFKNIKIKKL